MTYSEKIYHAQECREIPVYTCSCCGEGIYSEDPYYDIHGEIYCENCHAPYGIILQEDAISSARHFTTCDLRKLLQVSLSAASAESLSQFSEKYLRACLERHFKTLDFYNGLLDFFAVVSYHLGKVSILGEYSAEVAGIQDCLEHFALEELIILFRVVLGDGGEGIDISVSDSFAA